jgi:hypothetical protein
MITRLFRALPLAVAVVVVAYALISATGTFGVVLIAVVLVLAGALALWAHRADASGWSAMDRTATGALLCAPGVLVVYFSFSSGGFFPESVALADVAIGVLLLFRLGIGGRPLEAFGRAALIPLAGLAGLAGWALLSQFWSHAPGRATIAFDRDLLYALTFALYASVGRTHVRITWAIRGIALAMAGVATISLFSRVEPNDLATTLDPTADGRLAYPLTYWNALGVFCAIAAVLCLHLASTDERRRVRVLAAGALPVIGTTLLLTYSRGGLAVAGVGLVAYALLGRPRGLLSALLAAAPTTAIAMKSAYDDTLLSSATPTTPAAVQQGHHLALVVFACVVAAMVLRALLLVLDHWFESRRSPIDRYRRQLRGAAGVAAVGVVVAAIALGAPNAIANGWNQFANQQAPSATLVRSRLGSTSNDGRLGLWKIALNAFDANPLNGTGADTYEILFYEHRTETNSIINAHSLYIETMSDLGIVGLLFVLLFVLGTLAGLAPVRLGRERALYAALFSAGLAWAIHAGVDWDWQMPAASLWFAALGGLALGRPGWRVGRSSTPAQLRAFVVGAVVCGACVFPALVLASQDRLTKATNAFEDGNCKRADKWAERSIDALSTRAGPWQIEALCAITKQKYVSAEVALRGGLAADPKDWQLEASLAATTAVLGGDARAEAADALALNPLDPDVQALAHGLARGPSRRARDAARTYLATEQTLIESG